MIPATLGIPPQLRASIRTAAVFSAAISLLMLTGPVFLLQLYDRVLPSRSVETLLALFLLMTAVYTALGWIDLARAQILARIAARFQASADGLVFTAFRPGPDDPLDHTDSAMRDVEAVRQCLGSPAMAALFDLPFTPIFVLSIFLLHPDLGWLATAGAAVMIALTCLGHVAVSRATRQAGHAAARLAEDAARSWTDLRGLGMTTTVEHNWLALRQQARTNALNASDTVAYFSAAIRAFRLFLQSALMAYGAWIVLRDGAAPGAMMAASILSGRALAPVDQLSAHWSTVLRAVTAWRALSPHLGATPWATADATAPSPGLWASDGLASLSAQQLSITPPGREAPILANLGFAVAAGKALAIVGPSGAGKSTLARVLAGALAPTSGDLTFRDLPIRTEAGDATPPLIGYLPQDMILLPGTLAQNIARFHATPDMAAITRAARLAGIHDTIAALPDGYGTVIGTTGRRLSGGQLRRVALARALYGEPMLLILDEPAAHMDQQGCDAIRAAIRSVKSRDGIAVITGHAVTTLADCEVTLVLDHAGQAMFGPTEVMLRRLTGQPTRPAVVNGRAT